MINRSRQLLRFCFLLSDLVLTTVAWFAAYFVRFQSGWMVLEKDTPDFYFCWRQSRCAFRWWRSTA